MFVSWQFDCDAGTGTDPTSPHIDDLVDFDGWDGDDTKTDELDIVENIDLNENGELDGYDEWGIPYGTKYHASPDIINPNYDASKINPDGFYDEYTILLDPKGPPIRWQTPYNPVGASPGDIAVINGDTLKGYMVPRNTSYIYDGDDPTSPEYDAQERQSAPFVPGYIGGRLIYTPLIEYDVGDEIPPDSVMRVFTHQWWNWASDPGSDVQKYDYMAGIHPDSRGKKFMPHPFEIGAPTFDYRFLITTGPFQNFEPGDTLRFVYSIVLGWGLRGMRQNADNALRAYYSGSLHSDPYNPSSFIRDAHWRIPVPPPVPKLIYSPIDRGAKLAWDNLAETAKDEMLGRIDFEGYKVYRALYAPENWQLIGAYDSVDGPVYVIDHATKDTLNNGQPVDLPDIKHTFIDTGGVFLGVKYEEPINGLPYFYVVTAYDPYKPDDNLPSIESSRSNFMVDPESGAPLPVIPRKLYEEKEQDISLADLDVKVVPNPYRGTALFESRYESKIRFTNLPPVAKVSIFTIAGDLVKFIDHTDGSDSELWDLVSKNNQDVVSGLYIWVVETKNEKKMGKFVIIR
ncbi:MAG: T9SS type A sorting domain-containing protein, partial [Fidelibacterota bacterium]